MKIQIKPTGKKNRNSSTNVQKIFFISAFIIFSLFFNCNTSNELKNFKESETEITKNKENNIIKPATADISITPIKMLMVTSPEPELESIITAEQSNLVKSKFETETTAIEETAIEEISTETATIEEETSTIEETSTTEKVTEPVTESTTETSIAETESTTVVPEPVIDEYNSLDDYIYSLINEYSSYNTRIELNYDNVYLLAQLAYAEAGDQPFEGKIAVCEVCINRLYNKSLPSIKDVIYSPGQFSTVSNGSIYNTPTESEILAAVKAIVGDMPSDGSLYFDNPDLCNSWASRNREKSIKIGEHQFYY